MRYFFLLMVLFIIPMQAVSNTIDTPKDHIPNFAENPTITTVTNGNWFDSTTWDQGRVPASNDVVRIDTGHQVTYNGSSVAPIVALGIDGHLLFSPTIDTSMVVATIIVYRDGRLDIGTESNPIISGKTAEIIFLDRSLATSGPDLITGVNDPDQYANGFIVLGEINVHGEDKGQAFARLTDELLTGASVLTMQTSTPNWSVGDTLVIPDSSQRVIEHKWSTAPMKEAPRKVEEFDITALGTGNSITLSGSLVHDHPGVNDSDGDLIYTPHVANITRNVVFRSENPQGVRAHGMLTERAKVNIKYAAFLDMGRTTSEALHLTKRDGSENITQIGSNQIGRYPVHFHHHMGPANSVNTGYQAIFVGNVMKDCEKWCFSLHNSHYTLVEDNVFYLATGSGLMTEDGNERDNLIRDNIAIQIGTLFLNRYKPRYGGVFSLDREEKWDDFGWEGSCFWYTGNDNNMLDNVCAGASYAGHMLNARGASGFGHHYPRVPLVRGADILDNSQWDQHTSGEWAPPVRSMVGNEAYGIAEGYWISFAGDVGQIDDAVVWHASQLALYSTRNLRAEYHNFKAINDQSISNQNYNSGYNIGISLYNQRYQAGQNTFNNLHVEGFSLGIALPSFLINAGVSQGITPIQLTLLDSGYLRNYVNVREMSAVSDTKSTVLRNVEFVQNTGPSRTALSATSADVISKLEGSFWFSARTKRSRLYIEDYNKQSGVDFEFFFSEQAPGHVMEELTGQYANPNDNCPTVGFTNQQCMDTHGVANLDMIAPCADDTTRPGMIGYTCSTTDTYQLNEITASHGAHGTISLSGVNQVADGGSLTFTITPITGYEIDQILVDGVALPNATLPTFPPLTYTFDNVTADHTIHVSFKEREDETPLQYKVTATIVGAGTMNKSEGEHFVFTNESGNSPNYLWFYFTPAAGHKIDKVVVNGVSKVSTSHTVTDIGGIDQTLEVHFVPE